MRGDDAPRRSVELPGFWRYHGDLSGQVISLFIIAVAACEAGLALALFLMLYRRGRTLDSASWQNIREAGVPATIDREPLPKLEVMEPAPTLPIAGLKPKPPQEETVRA